MFWYLSIAWLITLVALFVPKQFYKTAFDRLTKGKYREDKVQLDLILQNLREFPEQWSIDRNRASYPREGSKSIYLERSKNEEWRFSMPALGSEFRSLSGHYDRELDKVIAEQNKQLEVAAVMRKLYPETEHLLLR